MLSVSLVSIPKQFIHLLRLLILYKAGSTGAAPLAIGGGSIGDLFSERDRALAMAVYVIGPLIGMVYIRATKVAL